MADEETNEFEDMGVEENAPDQKLEETPDENNSMIDAGSSGEVYDWTKAPEGTKAPPRVDMDGKTVTIKKADIILPPEDREWLKSRNGKHEYKYCTFSVDYEFEGQREFISGCRVFKRENGKYSHPTIMNDGKNQATKLKQLYADFKNKDITDVSLKEFMAFLNGKPKCEIKVEEVENPETGAKIRKNMIGKFVN